MNEQQRTVRVSDSIRPEAYGELLADIKQEIKTAGYAPPSW